MKISEILKNPNISISDDRFGHIIYGDNILFICLTNEESLKLMKQTKGKIGYIFCESFKEIKFNTIPDFICFKDELTTYSIRFSDFNFINNGFQFTLYAMKPVYYAMKKLEYYSLAFEDISIDNHRCIFLYKNKNN